MKDPLIHVEKNLALTHAEIRAVFAAATGLAINAPTVVTTGCGRRRPYAMTSPTPERVTCLACREYARRRHTEMADLIETAIRHNPVAQHALPFGEAAEEIARRRDLAARFA